MNNAHNLAIYRFYAPFYDCFTRPLSAVARRRAIEIAGLRPGERLLIPGAGSGLDLPYIPDGIAITAADLSPAMLARAHAKTGRCDITFALMDAQALAFPDASFDAVLLNLILSVVPDGAAAFAEAWRVLRPGGRAVIFDKFLPTTAAASRMRGLVGDVLARLGTDPNRRMSDILGARGMAFVERDEPSLLRGQYRIVLLQKP
jgi:ubiquinone/menaquinone biosynthesis C-methylase UbiE